MNDYMVSRLHGIHMDVFPPLKHSIEAYSLILSHSNLNSLIIDPCIRYHHIGSSTYMKLIYTYRNK
eukprot:c30990_g1_i1 orf=266-463(+)